MNGHTTTFDMYYDNPVNRSPTSQRQNSLHRQSSRQQLEAYAHLPSGLYTAEDHAATFNGNNNRFGEMRNATIGGYGNGYDMGGQAWNGAGAFGQNGTLNGLGGSSMRKPPSRGGRTGLPSAWLDQSQQGMPMGQWPGVGGMNGQQMGRQEMMSSEPDEELIPTAIVIKNIPFAIKKEQLVGIMTDMGLPLPYAFNYHFDHGVFRGLAFANFTNPDETAAVIEAMNHFELNGRKLRVEYKKMLPAAERDRIEREKRERRGQLEEQHRPMAPQTLQTQASASSLSSRVLNTGSPSPVSARNQTMNPGFPSPFPQPNAGLDFDLNDPHVLQFYSKLLIFKEDPARDLLVFPHTLLPPDRRIVHTLAHHMGLAHQSKGDDDRRAVHVYKDPRPRLSPPMSQLPSLQTDQRRALNRAATTDFSDVRANDGYYNSNSNANLRHQGSGYLAGFQDTSGGLMAGSNLRAAKSFADLRSYTPSPVPSTASFPAALNNNIARLQDFGRDGVTASTPTLMTPTSALADRGDTTGLINGLGNMNLGTGFAGSPRGLRGFSSWDRENPGPIGGHRSFSTNHDDRGHAASSNPRSTQQAQQQGQQQDSQPVPERQPRGPIPERGSGFLRNNRTNGHGPRNSDDLTQSSNSGVTVDQH